MPPEVRILYTSIFFDARCPVRILFTQACCVAAGLTVYYDLKRSRSRSVLPLLVSSACPELLVFLLEDRNTMSTEDSPLLTPGSDHNAIYDKFSTCQKRTIVALVSWAGLIPCKFTSHVVRQETTHHVTVFVFSSFVPTIPSIAHDLNTTGAVIRCV